ncbi:hypothetical protein ACEWBC_22955, partial [Vibrio parahaemolyticus]
RVKYWCRYHIRVFWVSSSVYEAAIIEVLTNCLRGIHNAWHFYFALFLVFKVVCGGFGIALLTP